MIRNTFAVIGVFLTFGLFASCSSSTTIDSKRGGTVEPIVVKIVPSGDEQIQIGMALPFTLEVRNNGAKSVSVKIELSLMPVGGQPKSFYQTTVFAPHAQTTKESRQVTPAQWFTDQGVFRIVAMVNDVSNSAHLDFEVTEATYKIPRFKDVTNEVGIVTTIPKPACGQFKTGATWSDIDSDGDLDLFVSRIGDPAQLFMNDGNGHFNEEGTIRGLSITGVNSASFADIDNDGFQDVYLARDGSDELLRNNGFGYFSNATEQSGLLSENYRGMSAAWGDFNQDGNLDLFVTNYMHCLGSWTTEQEVISQVGYEPDALYQNNGDGTFTNVTDYLLHGAAAPAYSGKNDAGFIATWFDYNSDGRPDLYLGNDFVGPSPDHNRLWRNDGQGENGKWKFTDVSLESGTGLYVNTMGIGVSDVDRDLDLDIAISNIGGNRLLRNSGNGTFVDDLGSGISRPDQESTYKSITWGVGFYDFNLDGWEDAYFTAGNFQQAPGVLVGPQPNELFLNNGTGKLFFDVSAISGAANTGNSKDVAFGDFNSDGLIDIFSVDQDGSPKFLQNVTEKLGAGWLEVKLVGTKSSRDACGANVVIQLSDGKEMRELICNSTNSRILHFGLGLNKTIDKMRIRWPSGGIQTIEGVAANRILEVIESN